MEGNVVRVGSVSGGRDSQRAGHGRRQMSAPIAFFLSKGRGGGDGDGDGDGDGNTKTDCATTGPRILLRARGGRKRVDRTAAQ